MTNEKAIEELSVLYERYSKASENRKHTASTGNYGMIDGQYVEAIDLAIKALEQTEWIPVSERLPEASGDYLVTTKWKGRYSGNVYVETNMAEYRKKTKEWDCVDVIAWMPLPQAYTESEVEK